MGVEIQGPKIDCHPEASEGSGCFAFVTIECFEG
jgi:hypothetical protein